MNLNNASARIDLQNELETLSVQLGINRYREALEKEGQCGTSAGTQLTYAAMEPMTTALKGWLGNGLASRNAGVYHFINQLDHESVAWMTAHACLNLLHKRPALTLVSLLLAGEIEATVNLDAILQEQPALAKKMERKLATMGDKRGKGVFIRKGAAAADVKVIQWDEQVKVRIGTLLIHLFCESTGLVAVETSPVVRGRSTTQLRPTESCRVWLEKSHARCELLTPMRLPMVCRPRDWSNPFNGGYLTHKLRQPLVKTRNKGYLTGLRDHTMPWVYASVNALQRTEWAVNVPIYEVVKALWEAGSDTEALPKRDGKAIPAKTWTEGTEPAPEVLTAWKVDAAKTYEANAKQESKRLQLVSKLWTAEMMMERGNRFHFAYTLDWRGRAYPVGTALTPQGDDAAKALLQFAEGFPLGDDGAYWLGIHTANSFGVDKVSFEERIEWVEANTEAIIECGRDPLANRWWMDADSPFVFLAACIEYAKLDRWVAVGGAQETFESHIAVAFDGSCNGLQNFSAMLRDPVGGKATGLIPSDKPADIYSEVSRAAQAIIGRDAADPESEHNAVALRWVGRMTRKLAKRNTMTVPYGVTKRGMRDQLFIELTGSDGRERAEDAEYLAACNFEAIGTVVVAARLAMDWLREAAKVAASTELPVRWVTPSGFLALQDYREDIGEEVDFTVLGRRYRLLLVKTGDKLATRKQALGISPNFVHSLDAAHLQRTVLMCKEADDFVPIQGDIQALAKRGITEATCAHFGYTVGIDPKTGNKVQLAPYTDEHGRIVAQKWRDSAKNFGVLGKLKNGLPLFGQHLWRDGGKKVVITEGEIDAMSVSQMQGNKWPVVSIPNGASGAKKALGAALEWLEKFEEVILMFDQDDPGREAVAECAPLFTPALELGVFIHFISHLTRPGNGATPHEEGGRVKQAQFRGSNAIGMWSHFMFGLERNTQGEEEEDRLTTFRCLKDRNTGQATGRTLKLDYDRDTGLLFEATSSTPSSPFRDQSSTATQEF